MLEQGGCEQEDAVLVDAQRRPGGEQAVDGVAPDERDRRVACEGEDVTLVSSAEETSDTSGPSDSWMTPDSSG